MVDLSSRARLQFERPGEFSLLHVHTREFDMALR